MYNPLNDPSASTYKKMKYLGQIRIFDEIREI